MKFRRMAVAAIVTAVMMMPMPGAVLASLQPAAVSSYDDMVLADNPVGYWPLASGTASDLSGNGLNGVFTGEPGWAELPNGDAAPAFNGMDQYVTIADNDDLEVTRTGIMTVEAWVRPDVLQFPRYEGTGYVHWMGKGGPGQHSWVARMYNYTNTENRPNRISGYSFNLSGGLGAGSYFQDAVTAGEWMHYALVINTVDVSDAYPTGYTKVFKNGVKRDQDRLIDYSIVPGNGTAPMRIGTRDLASFFQGAIGKVAFYDYELSTEKLTAHYNAMLAPAAAVQGIEFADPTLTMLDNETRQTVVRAVYDDGSSVSLADGVRFDSSNPAVATVDETGLITAHKEGTAVIKAVYDRWEAEQSVTVSAGTSSGGDDCGNCGGEAEGSAGTTSAQISEGKVRPVISYDGNWTVTNGDFDKALSQAAAGNIAIEIGGIDHDPVLLQLGTAGLRKAAEKGITLDVHAAGIRVTIPSEALAGLSADAERVELRLDAAGAKAKIAASGIVSGDPAYRFSGVALALQLEEIRGGLRKPIVRLPAPLTVELAIPADKRGVIPGPYTGVYYIGEDGVEYIGGAWTDGHVRFDMDRFQIVSLLEYEKNFSDMSNHWAADYVKRLAAKHIVPGADKSRYDPERLMTRADFVAMAARGFGLDELLAADGSFWPEDPITRQEAVAILMKISQYLKLRLPASSAASGTAAFADMEAAADWVRPYIEQARQAGIIEGKGDGIFDPQGTVTRAEAAKMMDGFLQ